jgi:protein tyrosine phosphatase (PTP) superfamily phosphohydrolase (DUF442 family)
MNWLSVKSEEEVKPKIETEKVKTEKERGIEEMSSLRIKLEQMNQDVQDAIGKYRKSLIESKHIPEIEKQVKEDEPILKKLLQSLEAWTYKIAGWIVKLEHVGGKVTPKYKEMFVELSDRVSLLSPDLKAIVEEVNAKYESLAQESAAERLKEEVKVKREESNITFYDELIKESTIGEVWQRFIGWISSVFEPLIDKVDKKISDIDKMFDKLYMETA